MPKVKSGVKIWVGNKLVYYTGDDSPQLDDALYASQNACVFAELMLGSTVMSCTGVIMANGAAGSINQYVSGCESSICLNIGSTAYISVPFNSSNIASSGSVVTITATYTPSANVTINNLGICLSQAPAIYKPLSTAITLTAGAGISYNIQLLYTFT